MGGFFIFNVFHSNKSILQSKQNDNEKVISYLIFFSLLCTL